MTSATKTVHCSLRSRPHCVWRHSAASRLGFHLFPVSAASKAKQTHGRRCGNSFTIRDGNLSTPQSLVKTGLWLRHAPKRFSLWSLRGFFLTRQKEISQKRIAGAFAPAFRCRTLARRSASRRSLGLRTRRAIKKAPLLGALILSPGALFSAHRCRADTARCVRLSRC